MRRRHRRTREIAFSFDSFLDVVANVVGIIIRLILVVWVGARSYTSITRVALPPIPAANPVHHELPPDPLADVIEQHRRELADAQARLLAQLRKLGASEPKSEEVRARLRGLADEERGLTEEKKVADLAHAERVRQAETVAKSLAELGERQRHLSEEIEALEKSAPPKQVVRYRTPVSRPVQTEEFFFECRGGRVTPIDLELLLADVKLGLEEKGKLLRTRWQVNDVSAPVGAFRLRYTVERERGVADAVFPAGEPENDGHYRYALSEWIVEPVSLDRGEDADTALKENSQFRRRVDRLDPLQATVTFWVYPDSFSFYRTLRDYLYERDLIVAGRPLPDGIPIVCSRRGTLSRGQ
jgi:hypothetical protein